MKRIGIKFNKKGPNTLNKLSLFQKNDGRLSKRCPLSNSNAPPIDYKNVSLLRKYISDNEKFYHQKSQQFLLVNKKINKEIKKAKILGLV